jgi:hypothetical protein
VALRNFPETAMIFLCQQKNVPVIGNLQEHFNRSNAHEVLFVWSLNAPFLAIR